MPGKFCGLTDAVWAINTIIWVLITGARWADVPEEKGGDDASTEELLHRQTRNKYNIRQLSVNTGHGVPQSLRPFAVTVSRISRSPLGKTDKSLYRVR